MGIASAQTAVSIEPLTKTVGQGETFNLNITVDPTVAIAGAQCDMSFNSSLVIVNSVTEGNLLKQDGAGAYFAIQGIDNVNGTVTGIAGAITSPGETVSTKGTFAIVSLTAKGVDGITGIDLSKVIVGDIDANEVDIAVSNGTVTVGEPPILDSIVISPESCDLNVGDLLNFTAACNDTGGEMTCPTLTWHSSNTAVGTITAGEFTALEVGTTTITASADGVISNEAVVTVNAPEDSKTLSNVTNFTLESGNVSVTGNFSVDVSGNVTLEAVGNVTAHVPNATTVGLGAGYEFINGAIVNVSGGNDSIHDALEGGNDTVTITLCVSDSMLDAMGLARSNVQIYVYDEDAGKWDGLTTDRVGTDCHTADISGYLSEAIVGISSKPTALDDGDDGDGDGGGGGTYPPGWFETPTVTPTVTATATPTVTATTVAPPEDAVTTPTKPAAEEEPIPEGAEETPTKKKGIPGFTAVFAIAGLLAVAYAMMRCRE